MTPTSPSSNPITTPDRIPLAEAYLHHTCLLEGTPQTRGMRSGQVCLAAGESISLHSTHEGEELIIPLTGRGQLEGPDIEPVPFERGSVVYVPPRVTHRVVNTGTEPLVYVYVYAPVSTSSKQEHLPHN